MVKSDVSKNSPKISVIVPSYNAETTLPKTVENLLGQTYKNIEIIILNDGSTDSTQAIAEAFAKQHKHIKVVNHEKNAGLFQARLTGSDAASGEYIAFLDADDTVSIDYYRSMMAVAQKNNSSMVLGEVILEDADTGYKTIFNVANDMPFTTLSEKEAFSEFMNQRGLNHNWHVAWNKLIRKDLWDKARPHYDTVTNHLIMGEDIAISVPLWFYAARVDRSVTSYNFYLRGHEDASTSLAGITYAKAKKNVSDLKTVFDFFTEFLEDTKSTSQYSTVFSDWKTYFSRMWHINSDSPRFTAKEKEAINDILLSIADYDVVRPDLNYHMYDIVATWDDGLEKVKESIADPSVKAVSFDIFDTLVVRPFGIPSDLFHFMEEDFHKLCSNFTLLDFHDIRIKSEVATREKHTHLEDITLDQIYDSMEDIYGIDKEAAQQLKKLEVKLEVQFTRRRETAFELYTLAKYLGKTTVLTTDMYLPRTVIIDILTDAGYADWDDLNVSSELNKTKHNGTVFGHVATKLKLEPKDILHIGDSEHADFHMALKSGYRAALFPSAMSMVLSRGGAGAIYGKIGENVNGLVGRDYYGIRSMLSVVANKFFDNPFTSYIPNTFYSARPSYLGYFALGMHIFGLASWLKDKTVAKYDNLVFLARDGYLPMQAYELLVAGETDAPKMHYIPTSRKAILPLSIINPKQDINHIHRFLNMGRQSTKDALKILNPVLDVSVAEDLMAKNDISLNAILNTTPYHKLTRVLQEAIDTKKIEELQTAFKTRYKNAFSRKVAVFDVGYSAKPEQVLSRIFAKPIDTLFIHSDAEGSKRSLAYSGVNLSTLYDYKPSLSSEIRELFISELGPSCLGYKVLSNGKIEVLYDKNYSLSYYEQFVLTTIHQSALEFIKDIKEAFGEYLPLLTYTNQYASLPHEVITNIDTGIDKDIFRPFLFEDDMGAGVIGNIATQHLHVPTRTLDDILHGKSKLTKAFVYAFVDRGQFIGRVKRKVSNNKQKFPYTYSALKASWQVAKRVKRSIKGKR